MSYTLIEGTFRVVGFQPDGDSVRFAPNDPDLVNGLPNRKTLLEAGKSIQLRLECIDALETHYTSGSKRLRHQPLGPAQAAREALLGLLGFTNVQWDDDETNVIGVDADDRPGYILSNTFDSYGARPVSYAFAGPPPAGKSEGDDVFLTPQWLGDSVNYQLVATGFAYPMYYEGAFHDLRDKLQAGVAAAKAAAGPNAPHNVWSTDATREGFVVPPDDRLTHRSALWPKLFRRVSSFLKDEPSASLSAFPSWLERNRDNCIDLDTGSWTALHNYVEWTGSVIRMKKDPTRLMFEG